MSSVPMYDYQLDAIRKMHNGCILCGGVGSGKSRTSLAYYYSRMGGDLYDTSKKFSMMTRPKDLYIITTARKRDTAEWSVDMAPFLLSPHPDANEYDNQVIVDSWNNIEKYVNVKDAFFIFDEQRVVGYGKWAKTFIKIARNNEWVLLSATPGDKWEDYMAVFIANGFYRNKSEFEYYHIVYNPRTTFPQVLQYINVELLIQHRDELLVDMDFKRKTTSHHEEIAVRYDGELITQVIKTRQNLEGEPIENAAQFCSVLRQITFSDESRVVALLELIEKHPTAIIFYNYDFELDILKSIDYGDDIEIAEWNGHKHEPVPTSSKWVYLVNYAAGAEGWNCITTDTIIFYSQNYSWRIMNQAQGRIDRLNTPYMNLWYYHLVSRSPIDRAITRALKAKGKFNEGRFYESFNNNSRKMHGVL
nr:MAG TPA: Chromatin remodeling complex ATPase [Caudoviricetes sp.]